MPVACTGSAVSVALQNGIVRIAVSSALHPALVLPVALAVAATRIAADGAAAAVAIEEVADGDDGDDDDAADVGGADAAAVVVTQMPNHFQIFDERSADHPGARRL